jgi:hypothetical protein
MKRTEIIFKMKWVRYVGMLAIGSSVALFSCDNSNTTSNRGTRAGHDGDVEMTDGRGATPNEDMDGGMGAGSSMDNTGMREDVIEDTTVEIDRGSYGDQNVQRGVGSGTMGSEEGTTTGTGRNNSGTDAGADIETDEQRGASTIHRGSGTATTTGTGGGTGTDIGQGTGANTDMEQNSGNQNNEERDTLGTYLEGPMDPARGAGTGRGMGVGTGAGTWQGTEVDSMEKEQDPVRKPNPSRNP